MASDLVRELLETAAMAYQQDHVLAAQVLAARACVHDPKSIDAWDFHGVACQALQDTANAERSYRKALVLARAAYAKNPADDKLALRQIHLLMRLGRDTDIEALFKQLQLRHPDHPALNSLMATWRLRQH